MEEVKTITQSKLHQRATRFAESAVQIVKDYGGGLAIPEDEHKQKMYDLFCKLICKYRALVPDKD